ncbi:hypothetical protein HYZ78_03135 [Candidatus Microgenomates bacterium]|nr:hypothetical protein [Candidatus Microgenomates bacterium]
MYNHYLYLAYWLVNSVVLLLTTFVTGQVVLGSERFNNFESAFYSGFWFTFLIWVCWDFAIARGWKFDRKFTSVALFLLFNLFAVFTISRFSYFTGFALTHYAWVLVIGVLAMVFQRVVWFLITNKARFLSNNLSL